MFSLPQLAELNKKEEIVRLLQQSADVNQQDKYRKTALYWACAYNRTELAEILLQNKTINVNLQNNYGVSPFLRACWDKYESVHLMIQDPRVDIILSNKWGWSPLMYACYNGNTNVVQLLLSYGRYIDIHKKSTKDTAGIKLGSTALDLAKQRNRKDIVQLLQQYQNNPKETQKTLKNRLNLKGKIIIIIIIKLKIINKVK